MYGVLIPHAGTVLHGSCQMQYLQCSRPTAQYAIALGAKQLYTVLCTPAAQLQAAAQYKVQHISSRKSSWFVGISLL